MTPTSFTRAVLAAAALSLAAIAACAAPATQYRFDGSFDYSDVSGIPGTPFTGSFSLELPALNYTGNVLLTAFSFSFDGLAYTLGNADPSSTPSVYFDAGQFSALQYVSTANGSALNLYTGFPEALQGSLSYTSSQGRFSSGSFLVTQLPTAAVPEPATGALALGGLGLLGWARRRRAD